MAKDSTVTPQKTLEEEFVELLKTAVEAKGTDSEEAADDAVVQFLNDRESDIIALSTESNIPTKFPYALEDKYRHGCSLLFLGWPEEINGLDEDDSSALSYLAVNCKFSLFKKIIPYLGRAVPEELRHRVIRHDLLGWFDILKHFFLHDPKEIKWILEYMPVECVGKDYEEILKELGETENHDENQKWAMQCLEQQRNLHLLLKSAESVKKSEQFKKCSNEIINFIEENEDAINLKGFFGDDLLLFAIRWNDIGFAEALLKKGCNNNPYRFCDVGTPLGYGGINSDPCLVIDAYKICKKEGKWEIIELMISYGSDPKLRGTDGINLFMAATLDGNLDKISGAFKELPNDRPFTDRDIIVLAEQFYITTFDIKNQNDISYEGWSPLAEAVFCGSINEVECLLKEGQTLNKSDIEKISARMSECELTGRPSNEPILTQQAPPTQQGQNKHQASPTQPGQTSSALPLVTGDKVDTSMKAAGTDNTNASTSNEASDSSLSTAQSGHTSTSPAPVTSKPTTKLQQVQSKPQASPEQREQEQDSTSPVNKDKMDDDKPMEDTGTDNTKTSACNEASDNTLSTAQSGWLTSVLEWIKSILNWIIQRLGYSASTSLSGASAPSASADIEPGSCTGAANGSTLNEEARGR
jgi:ankyrin repeat protein